MFSNIVRFIHFSFAALIAMYFFASGMYWFAIISLLFAASQLWGYFRYGTVWLAFRRLKSGDNSKAARLIKQISFPNLLSSQQRSYYELILGSLRFEEKRFDIAEGHFRSAMAYGPRNSNDSAIVESSIAETLLELNRLEEATNSLASARRSEHKDSLDPLLDQLEEKLDSAHDLKS